MKKEIRGINYFKAVLVISVILAHLAGRYSSFMSLYVINRLGNGGFAVTCFFVLSGFMVGGASNKVEKYHIRDSFLYAWRRLKPLYIVYLLSCYIFLNDNLRMYGIDYVKDNTLGIIKNLFLVHSWVITRSSSFEISGVSWYLSVLLFLWLLTPIIKRVNATIKNQFIKVIFGFVMVALIFFLYDKSHFLSYQSVLLRLFQYSIGVVGRDLSSTKIVAENKNTLGMMGLSLLLACFFNLPIWGVTSITTVSAVLFIVYLFTNKEREQTRDNLLNKIGKASGFIYLLHYPAVQLGCNSLYLGLPQNYLSCLTQVILIIVISIFVPLVLFRMSRKEENSNGV